VVFPEGTTQASPEQQSAPAVQVPASGWQAADEQKKPPSPGKHRAPPQHWLEN